MTAEIIALQKLKPLPVKYKGNKTGMSQTISEILLEAANLFTKRQNLG